MALRETNLIPEDILTRRDVRRHLYFWTGCLTISLALIWAFHLFHTHVVLAKKRTSTSLQEMHSHLGARVEEIKRIKQELDRLTEQEAVLESITINESYSQICANLADIMNEHTWLTQLAIDSYKKNEAVTHLTLTGFSFSNQDLGTFLSRLSNEPMFETVTLKRANESKASGNHRGQDSIRLIEFEIECSIS